MILFELFAATSLPTIPTKPATPKKNSSFTAPIPASPQKNFLPIVLPETFPEIVNETSSIESSVPPSPGSMPPSSPPDSPISIPSTPPTTPRKHRPSAPQTPSSSARFSRSLFKTDVIDLNKPYEIEIKADFTQPNENFVRLLLKHRILKVPQDKVSCFIKDLGDDKAIYFAKPTFESISPNEELFSRDAHPTYIFREIDQSSAERLIDNLKEITNKMKQKEHANREDLIIHNIIPEIELLKFELPEFIIKIKKPEGNDIYFAIFDQEELHQIRSFSKMLDNAIKKNNLQTIKKLINIYGAITASIEGFVPIENILISTNNSQHVFIKNLSQVEPQSLEKIQEYVLDWIEIKFGGDARDKLIEDFLGGYYPLEKTKSKFVRKIRSLLPSPKKERDIESPSDTPFVILHPREAGS